MASGLFCYVPLHNFRYGITTSPDLAFRLFCYVPLHKIRFGIKTAAQVGEELIIDMHHYRYHADCKTLVAFVYDPERYLDEPQSLENDLSRMLDGMPVKVIVA